MTQALETSQRLTFDEDRHEYFLDGKNIPSVTEVLQECGIIDVSKFSDLEYYRERGKGVHKATELWDKGTLDVDALDGRLKPYLDAYRLFRDQTGFIPDATEFVGFNEPLRYAGTLDKMGTIGTAKAILDLKTNAVYPWTALQLAGYNLIHGGGYQRYGLALRNDGTYRLKKFSDYSDHRVFESAVTIYHWNEAH